MNESLSSRLSYRRTRGTHPCASFETQLHPLFFCVPHDAQAHESPHLQPALDEQAQVSWLSSHRW